MYEANPSAIIDITKIGPQRYNPTPIEDDGENNYYQDEEIHSPTNRSRSTNQNNQDNAH